LAWVRVQVSSTRVDEVTLRRRVENELLPAADLREVSTKVGFGARARVRASPLGLGLKLGLGLGLGLGARARC